QLGSCPQETIDLFLSEDVAPPRPSRFAAEDAYGRHLVTLIFRVECTRETVDGTQTIMTLPDRRRTRGPLPNRVGSDELLRSALGKIRKAMEHVCLNFVLESHAPAQVDVTIDSIDQHLLALLWPVWPRLCDLLKGSDIDLGVGRRRIW